MYQIDAYSTLILDAAQAAMAQGGGTATDEQILPAVAAVYPEMTLETLRPRLLELGDNWLELHGGSDNTEPITVTGIKQDWSGLGDVAEGATDPGRE